MEGDEAGDDAGGEVADGYMRSPPWTTEEQQIVDEGIEANEPVEEIWEKVRTRSVDEIEDYRRTGSGEGGIVVPTGELVRWDEDRAIVERGRREEWRELAKMYPQYPLSVVGDRYARNRMADQKLEREAVRLLWRLNVRTEVQMKEIMDEMPAGVELATVRAVVHMLEESRRVPWMQKEEKVVMSWVFQQGNDFRGLSLEGRTAEELGLNWMLQGRKW
jgi:hypothetical protein